jgi:hypothetical protein
MKVPNPAPQIAPQFAGHPQPRRLAAGDLADLTQSAVRPAVEAAGRTQAAPVQADVRPERPGSRLDIRV